MASVSRACTTCDAGAAIGAGAGSRTFEMGAGAWEKRRGRDAGTAIRVGAGALTSGAGAIAGAIAGTAAGAGATAWGCSAGDIFLEMENSNPAITTRAARIDPWTMRMSVPLLINKVAAELFDGPRRNWVSASWN